MSDPIVGPGGAAIIGSIGTILIGLSAQWVIRRNKKDEVSSADKKSMDEIYSALVQGNLKDLVEDVKGQKQRIEQLEDLEQKRSLRQSKILISLEGFKTQIISLKLKLSTYTLLRETGQDEAATSHFESLLGELDEIVVSIDSLASISDVIDDEPQPKEKKEGDGEPAVN